jgi:uncharacterized protein (TIGR02597 family)
MNSSTQFLRRLTAAVVGSCAAFIASPLLADPVTATTDPVGFITLNVAGTGGSVPTQLSFAGLSLTRAVEYQGSAETVGASSLTDNDATWADNQFNGAAGAYFVELTSGANAGTTYDISSTTAATKTISLAQNLAAGTAAGVSFKVRKHWTIASVFGPADESGLGGGSSTSADQLQLWNGAGYDIYYYQTVGLGGVGWRRAGAPAVDAAGTVIPPEQGLILNRKQSPGVNVVLMGAVKTGQTSVPVFHGLNFIGNTYAASMTLGDSGIYTGNDVTGLASGSSSSADQILIWNGTGYDIYYYQTSGLGGIGWRKGGAPAVDAGGTQIQVGQSIIINRLAAGGFNWVAPQHPASL